MRLVPAVVAGINEDLANVDPTLKRRALDERTLLYLVTRPVANPSFDIVLAEERDLTCDIAGDCGRTGWLAFDNDEVAICIMAGQLGQLLKPLSGIGISALAMKIAQGTLHAWGKLFNPPLWIVVSPDDREDVERHLVALSMTNSDKIKIIEQRESYLFDPMKRIVFNEPGVPVVGPLGTGDVPKALIDDGCLGDFISDGGKYVIMMNANNVMASPDIAMMGQHITRDVSITCEVISREEGDSGGVIVWTNNHLSVLEKSELGCLASDGEGYLNTNTMIINADVLMHSDQVPWRYHKIRRTKDGVIIDGFEKALGQLTEHHKTDYIAVPGEVRHLPVKTQEDVQKVQEVFKHLSLGTMDP